MSDYNLGTARGVIRLEFQDAGTQPAEQAIEHLGSSGQRAASKVMAALSGAAAAVVTGVVATSATLATSVIKTGTAYNTLEQTSRAAFKTILGSAEAAEVMMQKIKEFGQTSPFPRQAFIEATQQMLGFGFAADDVVPILETINDATAALGGNADTIATFSGIFSKIRSNAKISGEEVARLGDIGVDAVTMLADAAGVTGEEMRKSISDGAVGADEAIAALTAGMREKFGGASANVKETWAGAVDRIKGAWRDLSSTLMEPIVTKSGGGAGVDLANAIADALRAVIPLAEQMMELLGPKLESVIGKISDGLGSLADGGLVSFFGQAKQAVDDFGGAIALASGGLLGLAGPALAQIPLIGPMFSALTGPIGLAIGAVAAMFVESENLQKAFGMLMDSGGELAAVMSPIIEVFANLFGIIAEAAGDVLAELIMALLPSLLTILKAITPIIEILGVVFEALSPILVPLIETAIYPLLTVLEALTPVIELLGKGLQWVADQLTAWAESAKSSTDEASAGFSMFNEEGMTKVGETINFIVENWPKVVEAFQTAWDTITGIWQGLVDFFTPIVEAVVAVWTFFSDTVTAIWEGITGAIQAFMDWWNGNVQPVIDAAIGLIVAAFTFLWNTAVLVWNAIMAAVQVFLGWWSENVAPVIQAVVDLVAAIFNYLWSVIQFVWNAVMTAIKVVVDWFMTYVAPVIKAAIDQVVSVMQAVWNVISTVWESIKNAVSVAVNAVKNVISNVWNTLVGIVKGIFNPIFNAIKDPLQRALDFIGGIKDKILGFFRSAGDWLFNIGGEIIGGLIRGLENSLGWLTDVLGGITNLIPESKGPIEKDRILLKPAGEEIMSGLIGGIVSQIPALRDVLGGITLGIPEYAMQTGGVNRVMSQTVGLNRTYPDDISNTDSVVEEYNFYGNIEIRAEDLAGIRSIEDFVEMLRVYKGQGRRS